MEGALTIVEKTLFLMKIEFFEKMETESVARIALLSKELHLDEGEFIFKEGEPAEASFLVVDGAVEIAQKGEVLREVTVGGGLGLLESVAPGQTHIVSARAVARTHMLTFTREDINYAAREYPEFALGLIRALAAALIKHTGLTVTLHETREGE
jgi:CRP-like cAMP-binding protein